EVDAAILELGRLLRVEYCCPAVDLVGAERLLDLANIVADADRAPHVVDGILAARIEDIGALAYHVPHVLDVGQLGLVELLEHPGLNLALEEAARRHDHVIAATAG